MALQIKLRAGPIEKRIELPERPMNRAVVIGRAASGEVKVSPAPPGGDCCALFVRDGQWCARDPVASGRTQVNGQPALTPTALRVGDVITIGAGVDALTLEVDPAGKAAGRSGFAYAGKVREALDATRARPQPPQPVYAVPASVADAIPPGHDELRAIVAAHEAAGMLPARLRGPRKRTSYGWLTVLIVLAVVLAVGFLTYAIRAMRQAHAALPPATPSIGRIDRAPAAAVQATAFFDCITRNLW